MAMAGPGIHGKHPGFGDFITAGLPAMAERHLVPWWTGLLSDTRDWLGETWEETWDASLPIRFWIGGAIWGGAHLRGVARPSRDRVGRRFPLIAVGETAGSPPMLQPDQRFYLVLEDELSGPVPGPAELQARIAARFAPSSGGAVDAAVSATFWAANPALDVGDLLTQLDPTDRVRAVGARSYWWVAAAEGRASAVLACDGLPQAAEMAWLLTGVPAAAITSARPRAVGPQHMPANEDRDAS